MSRYAVIVRYEGTYDFVIDAQSEEEAKIIASKKFALVNNGDLDGIIYRVCDAWEVGKK